MATIAADRFIVVLPIFHMSSLTLELMPIPGHGLKLSNVDDVLRGRDFDMEGHEAVDRVKACLAIGQVGASTTFQVTPPRDNQGADRTFATLILV